MIQEKSQQLIELSQKRELLLVQKSVKNLEGFQSRQVIIPKVINFVK
jgi:hypothetical protein